MSFRSRRSGAALLLAAVANIFLAIPALSLAVSAIVIALMSGFILFDTSRMIHGGMNNYIFATVQLYMNIFNLFISLLHLLGRRSDRHSLRQIFFAYSWTAVSWHHQRSHQYRRRT